VGYKSLLKRYLSYLEAEHGNTFFQHLVDLSNNSKSFHLSKRDALELRQILSELKRSMEDLSTLESNPNLETDLDYNDHTKTLCCRHELTPNGLARLLGWPESVVERWLLEPENRNYKAMTKRDFGHLNQCLAGILDPLSSPSSGTNFDPNK
jgi:hypothetical protein